MEPARPLVYMSEDEYLRFEETSSERHEYVDGQIFAMSGASLRHNIIAGNIFSALHKFLDDTPCIPYQEGMKARVKAANCYYYPDVMVSCEDYRGDEAFSEKPVLIMEVLSPSTAAIDRREKWNNYRKIPSLQEYVLVHQRKKQIELYRRTSDGNWILEQIGAGEDLVLRSMPKGELSISLELIYKKVWKDKEPPMVKEEEAFYHINHEDFVALDW